MPTPTPRLVPVTMATLPSRTPSVFTRHTIDEEPGVIGYPVSTSFTSDEEIHARVGGRSAGAGRRSDLSARDRDPSARDAGDPPGRGRQHDDVQKAAAQSPVVGGHGGGGVRLWIPGSRADLGLAHSRRAASGVGVVVRATDERPARPSPRHGARLGVGPGVDVGVGGIPDDRAGAAGKLPTTAHRLDLGHRAVCGRGAWLRDRGRPHRGPQPRAADRDRGRGAVRRGVGAHQGHRAAAQRGRTVGHVCSSPRRISW